MKKNFTNTFPAIAAFLLCSLSAIAQWTEIPIPIGASMPGGMKLLNGNVYTSYYSGFRVKCIRTSDYIHWSQLAELPATSSFGTSRIIPDGQHLYLFAFNRTQQTASAWKSTNEGQNWQLVNLPSPRPSLFTPVGDVLLAASDLAVQRIVNGSATWNITLTTPQRIWDMKRLDEQTILLATAQYVYRSMDKGLNWDSIPAPYNAVGITPPGLTIFPTQAGVFIRLNDGNNTFLFRSYDNGTSWTSIPFPGSNSGNSVADLLAIDGLLWGVFSGNIATSDDGGDTWEFRLTPIGIQQLAHQGDTLFAGGSYGFFKSYDMGATWFSGNVGWQEALGAPVISPYWEEYIHLYQNELYLSTRNGFFTTSNDGTEWQFHNTHGPFTHLFQQRDTLAFLGEGTFRSINGGTTWDFFFDTIPPFFIGDTQFSKVNSHLFASSSILSSFYRSADFGATWEAFAEPSFLSRYIAGAGNTLYVSAYNSILISSNLGQSFQSFNNGLGNNPRAGGIWGVGDQIYLHANDQIWTRNGNQWQPASVGLFDGTGNVPEVSEINGDGGYAMLVGKNQDSFQPALYTSYNGGAFWEGNWADGLPDIQYGFHAKLHNGTIFVIGIPSDGIDPRIWKRSIPVATKEPIEETPFKLFPNPARDIAWLTLDGVTGIQGPILLHDFTGRLVRQYESKGESVMEISLHQLPPGMYSISMLIANGRVIQCKLMVF